MNIALLFIVVFAIFTGVIGIIIAARQKRMKEVWVGKVTGKKIVQETRRNDEYHRKIDVYYVSIKLSDGTSKTISVGKKLYDTFSAGDTVEKKSGAYDPIKV